MQNTWLVLLPPILVLAAAFITKKVLQSLLLGIVSAALILANFNPIKTIKILGVRFWGELDEVNVYTFSFLLLLGIIIALMAYSGGTAAFGNIIKKKLKDRKSAESASIFLSFCFMIDDFFSSITVGSIIRPLTDQFLVARAKLAFMIDSLAAPLVILVPVSSWIAMLTAQLANAGISLHATKDTLILADPFAIYIQSIPFIFYSFLIVLSVIVIVRSGISFGSMNEHEQIAQKTKNLFGGKEPLKEVIDQEQIKEGSLFDFLMPLVTLFVMVFLGLLYFGNFRLFGGSSNLITALQHTNIFASLFFGALVTVIISLLYFISRNKLVFNQLPKLTKSGLDMMVSSIIVLYLAFTFSSLLGESGLQTGDYLAQLLIGSISVKLFPFMFYIASAIISIATGSSWGTIAVMVPLGIPMLVTFLNLPTPVSPDQIAILFPLIGAMFAGAITGDHISPIASTTVMSAKGAGAYHLDHVQTQFEYAAPAFVGASVGFLLSGFFIDLSLWMNLVISLGSGIAICLGLLYFLNYFFKK